MTKQAKTITNTVASKIAKAVSAADSTGSIVTQVCDIAKQAFKGEAIEKADIETIANAVVKERGLKGRNAINRASEIRNVLRAYVTLPAAVVALKKHSKFDGTFPWHASIKLARCVNKNPTTSKAVTAYFNKAKAAPPKSPQVLLNDLGIRISNVSCRKGSKQFELQSALLQAFEDAGVTFA